MQKKWLSILCLFISFFCGVNSGFLPSTSIARAVSPAAQCILWYRGKKFRMAADCFRKLSANAKNTVSGEKRLQVRRWIKNAAICYKKAAKQVKSQQLAHFLREQGILVLDRYIKHKFYANAPQKNVIEALRSELYDGIGYTTLTVTTGYTKAQIQVNGFRFSSKKTGDFAQKLRPGSYTIIVDYPNSPRQAKTIKLQGNQPQTLTFQLPKPKKRGIFPPKKRSIKSNISAKSKVSTKPKRNPTRIASLALMGGGGALVVTGGAFVILGVFVTQAARNQADGSGTSLAITRRVTKLHNQAVLQATVGWIAVGVGTLTASTGLILYLTRTTPKRVPKTTSALPSKALFKTTYN